MIEYVKHLMAGMVSAVLLFAVGVLLHTCTAQPVQAQGASLERAADVAAQAEVMKMEAQYDSMSADSKMEGVVYE
ncbi:hypothetical protein CRG49_011130 [Neisseria sp. N95_16]|uniref:Uncharacterized protein n=1 Tax=Neisseria brasiliensis TaxID=2666100 RepID=A0A7X2H1V9_9NEIS|nr:MULTISPECIES: hypothetical protein [Neisseria]MRN38963.1 hypothetical protein [Neisseria brasiliensis]MRN39162.1 hypothetical protein [Neisseria brasiliensis]PJO08775.1 hypothetical protein CRG49_011130 [Neisseria sp. N95_16]